MIAIIDADSIAYILSWTNKEHRDIPTMHDAVDTMVREMLTMTGAEMYYGSISNGQRCFRYDRYKVKPYKGKREEEDEVLQFWKPIVRDRLMDTWKFEMARQNFEADDMIGGLNEQLKTMSTQWVICSMDKDLKQMPGLHYDYRKAESIVSVDEHQARYNFWYLMIAGDTTDNIAGIPGSGDKKAREKLLPLLEVQASEEEYQALVYGMYEKHFGPYYGRVIFTETYDTIKLQPQTDYVYELHSVDSTIQGIEFDKLQN